VNPNKGTAYPNSIPFGGISIMSVKTNTYNKVKTEDKSRAPKLRFTLGESERYFEPAQYLSSSKGLTPEKVKSLFSNGNMSLLETEGKSLKVMYKTDTEVKFCGFVTAGDASLSLDSSDVDEVLEAARTGNVKRAINGDELIAEF